MASPIGWPRWRLLSADGAIEISDLTPDLHCGRLDDHEREGRE
jgi:hypothetical protein